MVQTDEMTSYTVSQVARRLRISTRSVRYWIKTGRLRACQIGPRLVHITQKDLDEFLEWAHSPPEEAPPPDPEEEAKWHALLAQTPEPRAAPALTASDFANLPPPTEEELARRHLVVARIIALSKTIKIAPLTSKDLIREMKAEHTRRARRLTSGGSR
jgi:excisionase family DNA binding protein